jgi:hypothetical protein
MLVLDLLGWHRADIGGMWSRIDGFAHPELLLLS